MAKQPHAVVIGDIEVARRTCSELSAHGFVVTHLLHPTDSEMRAALTQAVSAVAVLVRGDVTALRYALLVEHLLPEVRLVVTLFDQTVAEQLVRVVPNCQVTSPANVAVPSIIGACVGPDVLAVASLGGEPTMILAAGEGIEPRRCRRARAGLVPSSLLRLHAADDHVHRSLHRRGHQQTAVEPKHRHHRVTDRPHT